jgi:hypothetical protein
MSNKIWKTNKKRDNQTLKQRTPSVVGSKKPTKASAQHEKSKRPEINHIWLPSLWEETRCCCDMYCVAYCVVYAYDSGKFVAHAAVITY